MCGGLLLFGRGDEATLFHPGEHMLLALLGPFWIFVRRIIIGGLWQPGQQGRLRQVQCSRIFPEIGLGRGGDAIGPLPEIDLVEIHFQDLLLAQAVLDFEGK